jgi:SAM-dependent methyltransferase
VATAATRQRWNRRYQEGVTPWDTGITPPEVVAFWQSKRLARQGVALDLGCGPGTNVRYLARNARAPLTTARSRLEHEQSVPRSNAHFVAADVCLLPFHKLGATYVLDVGCLHSIPSSLRSHYVESVVTNLAPGGYYHLYAFDTDPNDVEPTSAPIGMQMNEVVQRFTPALTLVEELIAQPDRRPCRWYLLQRPH